jgi:hypothetical protein
MGGQAGATAWVFVVNAFLPIQQKVPEVYLMEPGRRIIFLISARCASSAAI